MYLLLKNSHRWRRVLGFSATSQLSRTHLANQSLVMIAPLQVPEWTFWWVCKQSAEYGCAVCNLGCVAQLGTLSGISHYYVHFCVSSEITQRTPQIGTWNTGTKKMSDCPYGLIFWYPASNARLQKHLVAILLVTTKEWATTFFGKRVANPYLCVQDDANTLRRSVMRYICGNGDNGECIRIACEEVWMRISRVTYNIFSLQN